MSDTKHGKPAQPAEDELKKLKEELEKTRKECEDTKKTGEEYKTKYLRALADYQNFEKRVVQQRADIIKSANRELITKLLTFLDNLEKAEVFVKDANLKLVKDSFYKVLEGAGLQEIEVLGKEYDPYVAEVIDMVEGEKDNVVVEVLRKGYELNGNIIRIAQVKVSRNAKKGN